LNLVIFHFTINILIILEFTYNWCNTLTVNVPNLKNMYLLLLIEPKQTNKQWSKYLLPEWKHICIRLITDYFPLRII